MIILVKLETDQLLKVYMVMYGKLNKIKDIVQQQKCIYSFKQSFLNL